MWLRGWGVRPSRSPPSAAVRPSPALAPPPPCAQRPANPVEWLAHYLLKNDPAKRAMMMSGGGVGEGAGGAGAAAMEAPAAAAPAQPDVA